jgi:PAS domain S-box-containing protein
MVASVRLLHVDDEPDFPETAAAFLEREMDGLTVETAPTAEAGLACLETGSFDCVVSDYDMPGRSGVEFLRAVRERYGDLPFLLFTGKGSEEVASAAISAGVTDYLQKGSGTDQYAILANRIENAVGHHRSQRALEESQRRLSLFVEQSPLGVVGYDESFTITTINGAAEEILGYDAAELVGGTWKPFVPGESHRHVAAVERELLKDKGGYHSVNENVRKDGERIRCEWHNRVVTDGDDEVVSVFSLFRDVTEEQAARERLRHSERRYRTLVESFPDGGVFLFDEDCRYTLAGGTELEAVGLSPGDLCGTAPHDHFPEPIADELVEYYRKALTGEEHVFEQSYMGERYRIHTVPVGNDDGTITEGMAVSQNVTERRSRELRLERLHEATRELIHAGTEEAVADAVVEAADDILGFSIVMIRLYDAAAGGLVPVAASDSVGEVFGDRPVFTPEGGSLNWQAYESGETRVYDDIREAEFAVDKGTGVRTLMLLPIGEYGTLSVGETEVGALDETDVFLARILVTAAEAALEATEREAELRRQRNELERQNDRLDGFAGVVSHDLRNPLNVAQGRLELVRDRRDDEGLEVVESALDRMETLIENVLLLAREGDTALDPEPVSLVGALGTCREGTGADEVTLVAETDRTVLADRARFQQLLGNLVCNAAEHGGASPAGRERERSPDGDGGVTVTLGPTDAGFYVEDDGPGIPPGERESVFDPGYSTTAGGTGFGLSIVRRIAEEHGWTVRATEGTDGGARFEFDGAEFVDERER